MNATTANAVDVQRLDARPPQSGRPSYPVEVVEAVQVTPNMRRLTFVGEGLASLRSPLPAQWMKVVLNPPGSPSRPNRAYTIRHLDPDARSVVMDFVLHGDGGPLSAWAARANLGDKVYLGAPRGGFQLDASAPWLVLAGDETALPAIISILGRVDTDRVPTVVFAEIPTVADTQDEELHASGSVVWLPREGGRHGELLQAALEGFGFDEGPGQIFMAGEATCVRAARFSVANRTAEARIVSAGYWRLGVSDHRD